LILKHKKYRNLYILESRNYWPQFSQNFDFKQDIVFTLDFGLKNLIETFGGQALYADSLCTPDEMQKNNHLAAKFFKQWHFDKKCNDIFTEQGVSFGFAFRIEIWSEFLSYVRLRASLNKLKKIKFNKIFLAENNLTLRNVLDDIGLPYQLASKNLFLRRPSYFFDLDKYMQKALHRKSLKDFIRNFILLFLSNLRLFLDLLLFKKNKKFIYMQIYHPTKPILDSLLNDDRFRIVTASLIKTPGWRNFFIQRMVPASLSYQKFNNKAEVLFKDFKKKRCAELILYDGSNATNGVFSVIERKIKPRIAEALSFLDSAIIYSEKIPINLEIMIANIGLGQTIMDCVLKHKGIPSYLIINGFMGGSFLDEAKYATYINCYSKSIKKLYYKNARNIYYLGDPRMDFYLNLKRKNIDRNMPIVTIGTSGFNNLDLNSYLAIEFDFMFDVLTAFRTLKNKKYLFSMLIKVRPNGVLDQYKSFVAEYFPDLPIDLVRDVAMIDVLRKSDLYISIYSQTLFEASCLGIPAIYFKKDKEYLDAPFDGKSELVTVRSVTELQKAFIDFKNSHSRFDRFLKKPVMEKYIGPLDGKNTLRNLNFINDLLNVSKRELP
jgi:hypothetical protein